MQILVKWGKQPILETTIDGTSNIQFGLSRDRNPDSGWGTLSNTRILDNKSIEWVEFTPELRGILLEDIAYVYGQYSKKFSEKMIEFKEYFEYQFEVESCK